MCPLAHTLPRRSRRPNCWNNTNPRQLSQAAAENSSGSECMNNDRVDELKRDIAGRLRCAVGDMGGEEFETLITRMAQLQHKYEVRQRVEFFRAFPA